jgi:hypothetical protein
MIKSDDVHNIVVVLPSGPGTSPMFWTGSGESGFSRIICERVATIRARERSLLPLGSPEQEHLKEVLMKIPPGVGDNGLYIREKKRHGRRIIMVYSLHGSRFNRVLALLLKGVLGRKVQVSSTDFLLRITGAGTIDTGTRIKTALETIRGMSRDECGSHLPLPPRDGWKFAGMLPEALFFASALSDHYLLEEFMEIIGSMEIVKLPDMADPPETAPE